MLALLLGCVDPTTRDVSAHTGAASTGATAEPGHSGSPGGPEVTCVPQPDNVLRYTCGVRLEAPAAIELTYARADGLGAVRTARSDAPLADHTLDLWFLASEQEYTFSVRAPGDPTVPVVTGSFVTGILPAAARSSLVGSGTSTTPYVLMISPCTTDGSVVVFETATGALVWYEELMPFVEGVSFTEDSTVLALGAGRVVEVDLAGRELLHLDPDELGWPVHHDVFRRDGRTYVLFKQPWTTDDGVWILDGFLVFEGEERLFEWSLSDHRTPSFGEMSDWSHANAIWVDEARQVYVSLRHLSAILKVDGEPTSPTAGAVAWQLSAPGSPLPSDFPITTSTTGPADFARQHNVHLLPDGRVTMFDNRNELQVSRIVDLRLDEGAPEATIEAEYPLPGPPDDPGHCDFQGGAWRTPAGNPLATCAPYRKGYEFDPTSGEILWEAEARCLDGIPSHVPRFVPIDG